MKFKQFMEIYGSSFFYTIPSDFKTQMYDFYMLNLIDRKSNQLKQSFRQDEPTEEDKIDYTIKEVKQELFTKLKEQLLLVISKGLCSEFRHLLDANKKQEIPQHILNVYNKFNDCTELAKNPDFIKEMRHYYRYAQWNQDYGGDAWVQIANAWLDLYNAKNLNDIAIQIDHVYDLEHNTGSIFYKVSNNNINIADLDYKANISHPSALMELVSSPMKKLALRTLNNKFRYQNYDNKPVRVQKQHGIYYILNGQYHSEDDIPSVEEYNGSKLWHKHGKLHRENGPATISTNGNKSWYKDGKLHREDGPAIEYHNGDKEWWINGKRHREDGPAVEYASGNKYWYKNGLRHREDGPAVEYANGDKEWWINGKRHREDGPAVEYATGAKEWWINGIRLTH